MTIQTKRVFDAKRRTAEILNVLYYVTIFPFLFHNFYKFFRYLFLKNKLLKSSTHFREEGSLQDSGVKDSDGSIGKNKKVLKKIPLPGEDNSKKKFNWRWIAKLQPDDHSIKEIIVGEIFPLMAGKEYAAKARLMKDERTGEIYIISKFFEDFKIAYSAISANFSSKRRMEDHEDYNERLKLTETLEGYEEMLLVSLLTGRYDVHSANWGIVSGNRVVTFDYGASIQKGLSIQKLLDNWKHPFERIVCDKFLNIAEKVIEKFEKNHDEIEQALLRAIEAAELVFPWWESPYCKRCNACFYTK